MALGIILLVLGAIALVVYYNGAPENWLRITGIILLIAGLVVLLLPLLLDGIEDADAALASAVAVMKWRMP